MFRSKIIKMIVEGYFAVGDLGKLGRSRPYPYMRYIYFALCREFTDESLASIGSSIGRDHATVLHGLQQLKDLCGQKFFEEFEEHYNVLRAQLSGSINAGELTEVEKVIQTADEVREAYRLKFFRLIEKNHRVIKNMNRINNMKMIPKIAELPESDVSEFNKLVADFYDRKRKKKSQTLQSA